MPILHAGQVVRDTYEVERKLGEGAFAEVYRVRHRFLGRQAMKVFKVVGSTPEEIERDVAEALMLSQMRHPNIVEVYDANVLESEDGPRGYFTMTLMPGGTLERYWRAYGSKLMPVVEVVEIAKQICRGLAVAHSSNPPIVHRDIKPQNVLVGFGSSGLHIRLSDFGLAKEVNPLTLLASSRGTLGFKPPESLENLDSCAADIWSIGTVMYLLLTDQMPVPLLSAREVADARQFLRPIRPPGIYNVQVDSGLEAVIFRCLAAEPADRYSNAGELLHDLDTWDPNFSPRSTSLSVGPESTKVPLVEVSREDLAAEAKEALGAAIELAKDPVQLASAADLLEEAISKDPSLRERYESRLRLMRMGIMSATTESLRTLPSLGSRPTSLPNDAGE